MHFKNVLAPHISKESAELDTKQGTGSIILEKVQATIIERMWVIALTVMHASL